MARILFVSISFPPKSDAEGLQVAKYFKYLGQKTSLIIDVVTSKQPTLNMPFDSALLPYSKGVNQLIELDLKESKYLNFVLSRLNLIGLFFPDIKHNFHKQYAKVINQLKVAPDIIYSRADPKSSTILAYHLKKHYNVPWILHMSDPWSDCPIRKLTGALYEKHNQWEELCFNMADIISLTSNETIQFYAEKYPHLLDKFHLFPNVFDRENISEELLENNINWNRKFRMVYTGSLANDRTPSFILEPLVLLHQEIPNLHDRMEFIIAGEMDFNSRKIFKSYNLPFVNWLGSVSFDESRSIQNSADYLVAIDFMVDDRKYAMFFLSKLLDYMLTQRRILVLTIKDSTSDKFVLDHGGDSKYRNDVNGIKEAIKSALLAFESRSVSYLYNKRIDKMYDASYNVDRLYAEIIRLCRTN